MHSKNKNEDTIPITVIEDQYAFDDFCHYSECSKFRHELEDNNILALPNLVGSAIWIKWDHNLN